MRMKSRVTERTPNETEVSVVSDVNVVGVLAQFGRGMIQDVSDQMFQKFTDAMRRQLETAPAPAPPAEAAAVPVVAPPPPTPETVLDVGSIGAAAASRAAGRILRQPGFWIAVIVLALLLVWLLSR